MTLILLGSSSHLVVGVGKEWIVYPEDRMDNVICEGTNRHLVLAFGRASVAQYKSVRRGVTEFWRVTTEDWLVTQLPGRDGVSVPPCLNVVTID